MAELLLVSLSMANTAPPPWRTDRSVDTLDVVVSPSSRHEATMLTTGRGYRRGADAPAKSSLPFFVMIGLAVGLFAFAMMSVCLPDPVAQIAAREAAAAKSFPPPPAMPVEVILAPAVAPSPVVEAAPVAPVAPTPKPRVRARGKKTSKTAAAAVPSNPYSN